MTDLKRAVALTSQKRRSEADMKQADEILKEIQNSDIMRKLWEKYQRESLYAKDISFDSVIECANEIERLLR